MNRMIGDMNRKERFPRSAGSHHGQARECDMTEMVERVARAMADVAAMNYDNNQYIFKLYAEAAIVAMREPTKEMVDVGWSLIRGNLRPDEIYPHMIDAALNIHKREGAK